MGGCGCKASSCDAKQSEESTAAQLDTTQISLYTIPQMDCPAEEQLIRMKLASFNQIQQLEFDFTQRQLKVFHQGPAQAISLQLEQLNLGAKLTQQFSPAHPAENLYSTRYHIAQMDCAAEEQMVRMALAPLTTIVNLQFDLKQRTLDVQHYDSATEISPVLEKLGLGSTLQYTEAAPVVLPITSNNDQQQRHTLILLLAINAVLFIIELTTGILASSTGLIADSLDMFADAAVYGIALYAVGKAHQYQLRAAHISGWLQIALAAMLIMDVIRRFVFGSEPDAALMMIISLIALAGNAYCLYLISAHKENGVHMKASWIFSSNDVMVNLGVIVAGSLVYFTQSAYPDLIIGSMVTFLVLNGARKILSLR